jgi:methionyl-tRNA synthetase
MLRRQSTPERREPADWRVGTLATRQLGAPGTGQPGNWAIDTGSGKKPMAKRRILVTNALPYVNGPIHLGHMVEHVQSNVWVRFQRLRGNECHYFCGDDTHGTATMISARQKGCEPEELLAEMEAQHIADLAGFDIVYDHYGSTHSESNRELVAEVWAALRAGGHVAERDVTQLFDPDAGSFLADRFVQGSCPRCKTPEQYGDSCDHCGATYRAEELIDPRSTLSGAVPELRDAKHYFVELASFHDFLEEWTQSGDHLQPEVAQWLKGGFLAEGLRDWDVSRPAPYFGIEIPDAPGHYFYVWLDAPVGYIAATADWCEANGASVDELWRNPDVEIHHFIGKDIVYFHTLFWPAMLKAADYQLPRKVHVHGFLTVNGEKMSKRKGTFIEARAYLERLDPEYLRYYFASKLSSGMNDIDLNLEEFVNRVNSHLVGKVVNLASRTARFVEGVALPGAYPEDGGLFARGAACGEEIAAAYESCDSARALRLVMELADAANTFVEECAPWKLRKDETQRERLIEVCAIALNLFRQLTVYLAPVVPRFAEESARLLSVEEAGTDWESAAKPVTGVVVQPFRPILGRLSAEDVDAVFATGTDAPAP